MRLALKIGLAWQVVMLVITGVAYWRTEARVTPIIQNDHNLTNSLLHPSPADVLKSQDEIAAIPSSREIVGTDVWESEFVSRVRQRQFDLARSIIWNQRQLSQKYRTEITELIDKLAAAPADLDLKLDLASLLGRSYRFAGLKTWGWELLAEATSFAERAQVTALLAEFYEGAERRALLRGALGFATYSGEITPELRAHLILAVAADLQEDHLPGAEMALYKEVEEQSVRSKGNWGVAVYNQGVKLQQAGYPSAARAKFNEILSSRLNDREPGATLMETNRNYRHRAAVMIAVGYRSEFVYPLAYRWQLRAADSYPYWSWCGTCSSFEVNRESRRMVGDAFLCGPVFLIGHCLLHPIRTWPIWAVGVIGLFALYRRRSPLKITGFLVLGWCFFE